MAGQTASVGLMVAVNGGPVALAMAGWGMGMSKSRGRLKAGNEDARRLLGEGVAGESESEISSMCVHSFLGVCWEAEPRGFGLGILRKPCCGWVLTTMGS